MDTDIPLHGLQVNGQPFFARSRRLTLTGTSCPQVLKLSWLVHREIVHHHFIWLLSRLERCATTEPPWTWTSHHPDSGPVRFRAWLVSPVGYGGEARGSLYTTFRLHCHRAPDDPTQDTPPLVCPSGCGHEGPLRVRGMYPPPPTVLETLRQARGQVFADTLNRWFQEEPHSCPEGR